MNANDDKLYSARTAPSNYGVNFQDTDFLSSNVKDAHLAYGHDGSVYMTYVSGPLCYFAYSLNFLDPGTGGFYMWIGHNYEFINPVIAASRKPHGQENILIVASTRTIGTSDPYRQSVFQRVNGNFHLIFESDHISTYSLVTPSVYVRNEAGNEIIRTSYVKRALNSQLDDGLGYTHTYNGNSMEEPEALTDPSWDTYKAVIGETGDGQVCMAYLPLYAGEPEGIYFTSPNILSVQNQTIGGLSVYPVPAKETVTVSATSVINKIKVVSILGQTVMEVSANQNQTTIDTSVLFQGIYFLEIHSEGKSEIRKIIKN